MAGGTLFPLIHLPAYQVPQNALWNFAPINDAIDANRKNALLMDKQALEREQMAQKDKQFQQSFGLQREAADRQAQLFPYQIQQTQLAIENARRQGATEAQLAPLKMDLMRAQIASQQATAGMQQAHGRFYDAQRGALAVQAVDKLQGIKMAPDGSIYRENSGFVPAAFPGIGGLQEQGQTPASGQTQTPPATPIQAPGVPIGSTGQQPSDTASSPLDRYGRARKTIAERQEERGQAVMDKGGLEARGLTPQMVQDYWTHQYRKAAPAGFIYDMSGKLIDIKAMKEDTKSIGPETIAFHTKMLDDAFKVLVGGVDARGNLTGGGSSMIQRGLSQVPLLSNVVPATREALDTVKHSALNLMYALSGKQTNKAEQEMFQDFFVPKWDDGAERTAFKLNALRTMFNNLRNASPDKRAAIFDSAMARAARGTDAEAYMRTQPTQRAPTPTDKVMQPQGGPLRSMPATPSTAPVMRSPSSDLKRKYGLE